MEAVVGVAKNKPQIHCITNYVTVNDCANALLAVGASPIMAHHCEEVSEITASSRALLLNLGATEYYDAMLIACNTAGKHSIPIIMDPCGISASKFRRDFCKKLVSEFKITAIRGNFSEILSLASNEKTSTGLDSQIVESDEVSSVEKSTLRLANECGSIIIASGEVDVASDGISADRIYGGDSMMRNITGAGCMASCILAAFLSIENSLAQASECMKFIGNAASEAARASRGSGSFRTAFIDSLYLNSHKNKSL